MDQVTTTKDDLTKKLIKHFDAISTVNVPIGTAEKKHHYWRGPEITISFEDYQKFLVYKWYFETAQEMRGIPGTYPTDFVDEYYTNETGRKNPFDDSY